MCLQYLVRYLKGELERAYQRRSSSGSRQWLFRSEDLLREKYGDPYRISNVYLKKINEWPTFRTGDEQAPDKFSVFLTQCRGSITKLTFLSILNHPHNLQSMVA